MLHTLSVRISLISILCALCLPIAAQNEQKDYRDAVQAYTTRADGATVLLQNYIRHYPVARSRHYIRALLSSLYFEQGRYAAADSSFRKVEWKYLQPPTPQIETLNTQAAAARAIVLYEADDIDAALPIFLQVEDKIPSVRPYIADINLRQNYALATQYLQQNKYAEAAAAFNKVLDNAPADSELREIANFNIALIHQKQGISATRLIAEWKGFLSQYSNTKYKAEVTKAVSSLLLDGVPTDEAIKDIALADGRTQQVLLLRRGMELISQQPKIALDFFEQAIANRTDATLTAEATYMSGEALYKLGNTQRAQAYLQDYVRDMSRPNIPAACYTLAYIAFNGGRYADALSLFKQVLSRMKTATTLPVADIYLRMGDCEYHARNFNQAIGHYDKALSLQPSNRAYVAYQKAYIAGLRGEHSKRLSLLNDAIAAGDANITPKALYEKGRVLVLLDQTGLAIETYQQLLASYPNSEAAGAASNELEMLHAQQAILHAEQMAREAKAARFLQADTAYAAGDTVTLVQLQSYKEEEVSYKATVLQAQLMFDSRQYAAVEAKLLAFIDKEGNPPYWTARAFILLAETCYATGREAEADGYLTSLRDTYTADDDIQNRIQKVIRN